MTILSVPLRFRLAVSVLFLAVPFIAIEVIIAHRAPWWNLPHRNMSYWALAYALLSFPLVGWLLNGKKWALSVSIALVMLWILNSGVYAVRTGNSNLGFFTVFLAVFFAVEFVWLYFEMERSFFDPKMTWFQGLPKPIPGLFCQISHGTDPAEDQILEMNVCRIDKEGVFLFSRKMDKKLDEIFDSLLDKRKLEMTFSFRDRTLTCRGTCISILKRGLGVGIRYLDVTSDARKDMGDFVQMLRGEGYV